MATIHAQHSFTEAALHDESLIAFLQESVGRYIPKEEFFAQAIPGGIDAETAWELVSFSRRINGYPRIRDLREAQSCPGESTHFWTAPPCVIHSLYRIASRTSSHAQLWDAAKHFLGPGQPLLGPVVEDLHAAAARDGLALDYEDLRRIIIDGNAARTPAETIVSNACHLMGIGEAPARIESFTTLDDIYRQLTESVERPSKQSPPIPKSLDTIMLYDRTISTEPVAATLARMKKWEGMHPLLGIIIQSDTIWMQQPFPSCNATMEVILRWMLTNVIDMPALRLVPLSKLRLDWEQGLISKEKAPFPYGQAIVVSSFGIDSTPYLIQVIQFLSDGLDKLEATINRLEATKSMAESKIAGNFQLNHRQQQILSRMVDDPSLVIDVGGYANQLAIAVSTARNDLDQLVSMGYCQTEYRGKKQVFWPQHNLAAMLVAL